MNPKQQPTNFEAFNLSLDLIAALTGVHGVIRQHDSDLAKQMRRAANSVALNLAEGRRRVGRDRPHSWRVAAGSADETKACLLVASAWGIVSAEKLAEPLAIIDSLLAILWRLTH